MSKPSLDQMKFVIDNQNCESYHYSSFVGYLFYTRSCYAVTKTSIYINWFLGGTRGDQLSPTEYNGGNQVKLTANQLPMKDS